MDAVQRAIRDRLALGYTQKAIARAAGTSPGFINHILQGRRLPGPNVLRVLGLAVRVIYEPAGEPELPISNPSKPQKRARAPEKAVEPRKPSPAPTASPVHELNTARVTVAVAHKLNPTKAWASFTAAHSRAEPGDVDALWLAHCRKCGTPQDTATNAIASKPSGLYSHLKTKGIERPDYRQPPALGNVRPITISPAPEAG